MVDEHTYDPKADRVFCVVLCTQETEQPLFSRATCRGDGRWTGARATVYVYACIAVAFVRASFAHPVLLCEQNA